MLPRQLVSLCLLLLVSGPGSVAQAQDELVSLDGTWDLLLDPLADGGARGLAAGGDEVWRAALRIAVPGVLESLPETAGYDGVAWYRTRLESRVTAGVAERLLLEFENVNYRADVWLDGQALGRHDGSDMAFSFDVTGRLAAGPVTVVVRVVDPGAQPVDGLTLGALPHAKESWYFNYGGLTGSVQLRLAPVVEALRPEVIWEPGGNAKLRVDLVNHDDSYRAVTLRAGIGVPTAEVLEPENREADSGVRPGGTGGTSTRRLMLAPGRWTVSLPLPSLAALAAWHPDAPTRHELHVVLIDDDRARHTTHSVGLRHFSVEGDHFELNGEPLYLRGVLYQPYHPAGLANPPHATWLRDELTAIKAAGFNLVRAHIRVMPRLYALCDELGLLVQAEPTLGWITAPDEHTLPAVDQALVALADAVRGHPSVVMIGLLNELSGEIHGETRRLLLRAAELLPGHLVLDDSGSWQGSAHYIAPGAAEPVPYDDLHVYRAWPWSAPDFLFAAGLGAEHERLVYVSEYGYGGLPAFTNAVAGFGDQLFLEDAALCVADARAAELDLQRNRLGGQVSTLDELSALGAANQARAAEVMAVALRSNPRVAGDTYTQWRDAAWECGAGLVDLWGQPKPALQALQRLNALTTRPSPDQVERSALPPARPTSVYATGTVLALTGREDQLVRALVVAPEDVTPEEAVSDVPRLVVMGRRPAMWAEAGIAQTITQLSAVWNGGVLLMLEPPDAGHPFDAFFFGYDGLGQVAALPFDVSARSARGHFVGRHLVFAADSPLTDDLGLEQPLLDERLGAAAPHIVLDVHDTHGAQIALDCLDGYGLSVGAVVQSVPFGAGHIVLSTLRFDDESLQQPMVERLLENVVRYAAGIAAGLPEPVQTEPAMPTPQQALLVGRAVWRLTIWFGLAERLAVQTLNGVRPVRDEDPRLTEVAARKVSGLKQVLLGAAKQGEALLTQTASVVMTTELELFMRKELELSKAFYQPTTEHPALRNLGQTLAIGRSYVQALRAKRLGDHAGAMAQLETALAMVHALEDSTTDDDTPR